MKSFWRILGPAALLCALTPAVPTCQTSFNDDGPPGSAGKAFFWLGGPRSLPIGDLGAPSDRLVSVALQMDAVQALIGEFSGRGYARRADLDRGESLSDMGVAMIAFEKPGVPLDREQPVILVASRRIENRCDTQVYGGVVASDDGDLTKLVARDDPEDPGVLVVGTLHDADGSPSARPENSPGLNLTFKSAFDPDGTWSIPDGSAWSYAVQVSTGHSPDVWEQYGVEMAYASQVGALAGYANSRTWQGAVCGAAAGWALAHRRFWADR